MQKEILDVTDVLKVNAGTILIPSELVGLFGKSASSLLQKIHYWSTTNSGVVINGRRWIYNTLDEWADQLTCSAATISRSIKILRESGVLIIEKLHRCKNNRTNYYTVDLEKLAELLKTIPPKRRKNARIDSCKSQESLIHRKPKVFLNKSESASASKEFSEISEEEKEEKAIVVSPTVQKPQIASSETPVKKTSAMQILEIFNKTVMQTEDKYFLMTKERAQYLNAVVNNKFEGSLDNWQAFCDMIAQSDFLMGRAKNAPNFKISLDWVLRYSIIDRMLSGDYGCKIPKKSTIVIAKELYQETLAFISQETNEVLREAKKKFLDFLDFRNQSGSFKVWLTECVWGLENSEIITLKTASRFNESYINTHFVRDMEEVLRRKVVCVKA